MTNEEERSSTSPSDAPASPTPTWKTYPYAPANGDPELVFPAAEGDQGAESNSYYVSGRLRGRASGREWAFLVIFAANDVGRRLRADFYTLALFDLESGSYGTYTSFDLPRPLAWRRSFRMSVAKGALDVSFESEAGPCRWRTRRQNGALVPFEYELSLAGRDAEGRAMRLELAVETRKPPLPVGGAEYAGVKTCMGQVGTHSYFQSDVRFSGRIVWGAADEEVDGDAGWIDRQWAPRHFGVHTDRRNSRYRHEWRQIHLDDGIEMSVWLHVDRRRGNRVIPFSGVTATDAEAKVYATTEFSIERLTFVRDPGAVAPLYPLTSEARWFADRYRLRVPVWNLELVSEPIVPAPAHRLPIEYWSGPTRISGTMDGKPLAGFGFHERTYVFARDFELVEALRDTVRHLPPDVLPRAVEKANAVWELDAFLSHGDYPGALGYLESRVRPELAKIASPDREHVMRIVDDVADSMTQWWVRPPEKRRIG